MPVNFVKLTIIYGWKLKNIVQKTIKEILPKIVLAGFHMLVKFETENTHYKLTFMYVVIVRDDLSDKEIQVMCLKLANNTINKETGA